MKNIIKFTVGAALIWVFQNGSSVGTSSFVLVEKHLPVSKIKRLDLDGGATQSSIDNLPIEGVRDEPSIEEAPTTLCDIQRLTVQAIEHQGTSTAYAAILELGDMARRRNSFELSSPSSGIVQVLPFRLPCVEAIRSKASKLIQRGWMSTNADSVDGIPSYHVNIVSDGKCLFQEDRGLDDFQLIIRSMYDALKPFLYEDLEPYVQEQLGDGSVVVSDVFLRHYGPGKRTSLSAHYDVTSYATVVMALDDSAKSCRNGLYTVLETSNHAALRQYFPLGSGEGVVHTWNVLHGVQIDSSVKERTSLIVWFSKSPDLETKSSKPSWLFQEESLFLSNKNGIQEFVQASAIESADSQQSSIDDVFDLYLESAAHRNSFAFSRLGSLCEEANDLSVSQKADLYRVLTREYNALLKDHSSEPWRDGEGRDGKIRQFVRLTTDPNMNTTDSIELAKYLWLVASIHGNGMAQIALADQLMYESTSLQDRSFENRLFATTLFVLATQQGLEAAEESLYRILDIEAHENQDGFESSPVVLTASMFLDGQRED